MAAANEPEQESEPPASQPSVKRAQKQPERRRAETSASTAAKSPAVAAQESSATKVSPATPEQAKLAVHFQSGISKGILTIYADENQILRRSFDFGERKGILRRVLRSGPGSGRIDAVREVPLDVSSLRVYVVPDGEKAIVSLVEVKWPEDAAGTLDIKVSRKGNVEAKFVPGSGS